MPEQFKSMNDLVEYLGVLEQRVGTLESQNTELRAGNASQASLDGNEITRYVSRVLPQTNLISPNFFARAFAVWGHFIIANLIIGLSIGICYACVMMVMFGSLFGNFVQSQK
jgi:hypothetical protein